MRNYQWPDLLTPVAGAWIAVSPWALGHADAASRMLYNAVAVGLATLFFAIADLLATKERWEPAIVTSVIGLWAIASPWVLGFSTVRDMMVSTVVAGAVVTAVSVWQFIDRYERTDRLLQ